MIYCGNSVTNLSQGILQGVSLAKITFDRFRLNQSCKKMRKTFRVIKGNFHFQKFVILSTQSGFRKARVKVPVRLRIPQGKETYQRNQSRKIDMRSLSKPLGVGL